MKEKTTLRILVLVSSLSPLFLIQTAYCGESINLFDIPEALGEKLGVDAFAGGLLASAILILIFILPTTMLLRGSRHTTLIVMALLIFLYGFCVAISWIPVWTVIVFTFILSLLFAKDIKGVITR